MNEIISHPFAQTLLACLLMILPLARIYVRVGLNPLWSWLLFLSLLVPLLGPLAAFAPLALKKWPRFPAAPPPAKPKKVAI